MTFWTPDKQGVWHRAAYRMSADMPGQVAGTITLCGVRVAAQWGSDDVPDCYEGKRCKVCEEKGQAE